MNIGIVGCGNISSIYLKNLTGVFNNTTVYAVCDIDSAKASAQAQAYNVEKIMTLDEMLDDPERVAQIGRNAREMAVLDANERIYQIICRIVRGNE